MFSNALPIIAPNVGFKAFTACPGVLDVVNRSPLRILPITLHGVLPTNAIQTFAPSCLAFKIYGDSELHWIILLTNNITDRYYQWPLNSNDFENYLNNKYLSK